MKANRLIGKRGFVSYLLVLVTGLCLTLLMLHAYKKALLSQEVQGRVSLKVDYREKQDAYLRSLVAITPNRAIRAMQSGSQPDSGVSDLSWARIFDDALDRSNSRKSISADVLSTVVSGSAATRGNASDMDASEKVNVMIKPLNKDDGTISSGVSLYGTGYPPALNWDVSTSAAQDAAELEGTYPIISKSKKYGELADGRVMLSTKQYPDFNQITYPDISFGYAMPGEPFVAKRNWWAFTMDMSAADAAATRAPAERREFVLSIYEVPAQLAISSNTFTNLGQFADNTAWDADRVKIEGGVFASRAQTTGGVALNRLAAHQGVSFGAGTTVGGASFDDKAFAAGEREKYEFNNKTSMPVSLPTESGRAAFVPINRGSEFYDRYAVAEVDGSGYLIKESKTLSDTTWNDYSVGAMQCAMHLDVIDVKSQDDQQPLAFEFSYKVGGVEQPPRVFTVADFNNDQTDENPAPFQIVIQNNAGVSKPCIIFMPQRMPKYLESLGADGVSVNHSISINVNYKSTVDQRNTRVRKPALLPSQGPGDIAVILRECEDLSAYVKGFSMVTNLRLYLGDNFNQVEGVVPDGYTLATGEKFYPPTSLFAPEKRFGMDVDPRTLEIAGQVGSLASKRAEKAVHLLDAKGREGSAFDSTKLQINLKPTHHPALLPPVTMMNWLVTVEEKRADLP